MLCSISTGKSGSTWLDRLRSNKGFPTDDDNIDQFLNKQQPNDASNSNTTEATQSDDKRVTRRTEISSEDENGDKDKEWLGAMNNVLSELFNMGESEEISRFSGRKSLRKQTNPKFCVISTNQNPPIINNNINNEEKSLDSVRKDENVQAAAVTVSLNSDNNPMETNDVEEKELFGYSRSEVTVIDTSFSVWKFDKLVFRRKNVWKVRDKKAKSRTVGRKKRKGTDNVNVNVNVNAVGNKKAKVSTSDFECALPETHNQNPQDDKKEEVCKETPDDLSQVPDKRSPRKSRKGGSSVILIKGIPTSKNSGARLPKSGFKDSQRQYKA